MAQLIGVFEQTSAVGLFSATTLGSDVVSRFANTGSPEGVVDADFGSEYTDLSTGDKYLKKTASGSNTGWELMTTGSGTTNLSVTPSPTNVVVASSSGTDATLPLSDATNAGLFAPADFTKVGHITVTQAVDLDAIETDVADHQAALGIADGAQNFGLFTNLSDNASLLTLLGEVDTAIGGIKVQSVVADIAARDAQTGLTSGALTYVIDASADATVASGAALYAYDGSAHQKISEFESLDVVSDLAIGTLTTTTVPVTNSNGTGFTVPDAVANSAAGATDGTAGVLSAERARKIDNAGSFAETIGDGVATSYTVTHNLATLDVLVQVVEVATGEAVSTSVLRTAANTVVVDFGVAVASNSYRVLVSKIVA
ncbi:MAG: hypothetical protein AAGJ40_09705 [Planctomycetota bacterium]